MRYVLIAMLVVMPWTLTRAAPSGGTVTGRVIVMGDDHAPVANPQYVYVYLVPVTKRGKRYRPRPVQTTIDQKDKQFSPHVRVVPIGSTIAFPNLDRIEHNVFSPIAPSFDLGRYGSKESRSRKFDDEVQFDIYCDIHRDMWAKVKVIPSEWFAPVDRGSFSITDVPPGTYQVHLWMPDSREVIEDDLVTVESGKTIALAHALKIRAVPLQTNHTRKDGSAYKLYP
ncbi:MAG TPA: hypothetical protein VFQ53_41330 [Kofleriaceae bacterium]|nr:hypothetical protein [Kofleriaceae bacterium]